MDTLAITLLIGICLLAGFVQGLAGFGFAMVTSPFLMLVMEPLDLVFLNLVLSASLGLLTFAHRDARQGIRVRPFGMLCLGMLPGILLGLKLLAVINAEMMKVCILVIVALSCGLLALDPKRTQSVFRLPGMALLSGFVSGLLTPTTGINGPPAVLFLYARFEDKSHIRSTSLAYLLFAMVVGALFILGALELSPYTSRAIGYALPTAWLGFWFGQRTFTKVSHRKFRQAILATLLLSSAAGLVALLF